jgi:hypothetical protein
LDNWKSAFPSKVIAIAPLRPRSLTFSQSRQPSMLDIMSAALQTGFLVIQLESL